MPKKSKTKHSCSVRAAERQGCLPIEVQAYSEIPDAPHQGEESSAISCRKGLHTVNATDLHVTNRSHHSLCPANMTPNIASRSNQVSSNPFPSPPLTETVSDGDPVPPLALEDTSETSSPEKIKLMMSHIITESKLDEIFDHQVLAIVKTARWINVNRDEFMSYEWERDTTEYFVRRCYRDFYTIMDDVHGRKGPKNTITTDSLCTFITGTPGIGKSVFGLILCRMLCEREKQTLLFYEGPDSGKSVFWDGRGYFIDNENHALKLIQKVFCAGLYSRTSYDEDALEIWSIADSALPVRNPRIRQICIVSPGEARIGKDHVRLKNWVKHNLAKTLAMPPCSWEEIVSIRTALFEGGTDELSPLDKLRARFDLWGGVPRTILRLPEMWFTESFEDQEFKRMRVKDALKYLGTFDIDHRHHSGRIFHLYPGFSAMNEDNSGINLMASYAATGARYNWASDALERKAWAYFRRQREADVIEYILTSSNDAGSRGKAFEEHIHQLLSTPGLSGNLRSLESGEEIENFCLQPRQTMFFSTLNEVDSSAEYWRPIARNHPSIDGYIPAKGIMIQMTVGKSHPINGPGLEKTLQSKIFAEWEETHPVEKLKFIFVTDGDNPEMHHKQSLTFGHSEGKNATSRRQEFVEARLEQYVLRVDIEGRLKELRCRPSHKRRRDKCEGSVGVSKKRKANSYTCSTRRTPSLRTGVSKLHNKNADLMSIL